MASRKRFAALTALVGLALAAPASLLLADEGMWLFNAPPRQLLKEKYGFEPSDAWLEHLRKSSVRFNSGGSGSFVSSNGLVMTNHHVGADTLQKIGAERKINYIKEGFYAKSQEEELKATDLELNVLMDIEDVTEKVNAAVKPDMNPAQAQKARRGAINTIEKESQEKTKLRSDVVTLYQGGAYHLYKFKKYTDVRLVFAPEKDIAFFGGDPDNFEYPRYDLDVCFFRAYEDGKPAKPEHYLKWSKDGCRDGELTFVSGHPGRTSRVFTVRHLEFVRDKQVPSQLNLLRRREVLLEGYSRRSVENAEEAQEELFGVQNSRKARLGGIAGLQDPAFFEAKRKAELELQQAVAKDPELQKLYGAAWDEVAKAIKAGEAIAKPFGLLEGGRAFNSEYFGIARQIVRLTAESKKPNAERLREYGDAGRETLEEQLFSRTKIHKRLETAKLADSLGYFIEEMGAEHPLVKTVLAGKSPAARAAELVNATKLDDVEFRKRVVKAGYEALPGADPMFDLAISVDAAAREARTAYETTVDEPLKQAYAKIAKARFAVQGDKVYPDATFTLRLAFGVVKGYREDDGTTVPPLTTLGGTFSHAEKHGNVEPFQLPKRWIEGKSKLTPETPFNFVSTADIIGGNSGSPVVNKAGELVGIIFDGNIQSLVLDYAFTEVQSRAVSVHSAAIRESIEKLYDAAPLAKELGQ